VSQFIKLFSPYGTFKITFRAHKTPLLIAIRM